MSLLEDFARVGRGSPCPVCGRGDWCMVSRDDPADPSRVICGRVESSHRWGAAGWLHRLRPGASYMSSVSRTFELRSVVDLRDLADEYERNLDEPDGADVLAALSAHLGLPSPALRRLQVGWTGQEFAFPMLAGERVCGIRLRSQAGKKWSVRGGREGLFVPRGLDPTGLLLVCEGPTDTAAALALGFQAIGRPSCTGGVGLVERYLSEHRPAEIVIVADRDDPGRRGAEQLADRIVARVARLRVIAPRACRDLRDWVRLGGKKQAVESAINEAAPRRAHIVLKGVSR